MDMMSPVHISQREEAEVIADLAASIRDILRRAEAGAALGVILKSPNARVTVVVDALNDAMADLSERQRWAVLPSALILAEVPEDLRQVIANAVL